MLTKNRKNKRRDNHRHPKYYASFKSADSDECQRIIRIKTRTDVAAIEESLSGGLIEQHITTVQRETSPAFRALLKSANAVVRKLRSERAERVLYYRAG